MKVIRAIIQQVRDLEQQLNQATQPRQPSVVGVEEEFLGTDVHQKTSPQDRNLSYIRTVEKGKREAFEVCKAIALIKSKKSLVYVPR